MFVIAVTNRHSDPDIFGPYPTEEAAETAMKGSWHALWDLAGEDGSVEVMRLRPAGGWRDLP